MDLWPGILIAAIPIVALLSFFLIIKWSFAKTHKSYWMYIALLVLLGGLMMVLVNVSGIFPQKELAEMTKRPVPEFGQIISQLPSAQVILLALACAIWIIGGNVLFFWYKRRAGRSWWACLNPFGPVFRDFDAKAWKILGLLLLSALALAMAGVSLPREASGIPRWQTPASDRIHFWSTTETAN